MNTSLSFLGTEQSQLPAPGIYGNSGVEAVLLTPQHLADDAWAMTWANIDTAVRAYGHDNVTFHFPMNDCDYVAEDFVRERLYESYRLAGELGLAGVVVHSNRLRTVSEWKSFDEAEERKRIFDLLADVQSAEASSKTWLGLENMPLVGNFGFETDPLFAIPDDFLDMPPNVGVVWDACHAVSSLHYVAARQRGDLPGTLFARDVDGESFDPGPIGEHIVHWHFAAYRELNNPTIDRTCHEGLLPVESDVSVQIFESALRQIAALSGTSRTINFEVEEEDYTARQRGPAIISWAMQTLARE